MKLALRELLWKITSSQNVFERERHSYTHFVRIEFPEEALNLAS